MVQAAARGYRAPARAPILPEAAGRWRPFAGACVARRVGRTDDETLLGPDWPPARCRGPPAHRGWPAGAEPSRARPPGALRAGGIRARFSVRCPIGYAGNGRLPSSRNAESRLRVGLTVATRSRRAAGPCCRPRWAPIGETSGARPTQARRHPIGCGAARTRQSSTILDGGGDNRGTGTGTSCGSALGRWAIAHSSTACSRWHLR
jgi:hypothetical protein